jgi:hypothetical protein
MLLGYLRSTEKTRPYDYKDTPRAPAKAFQIYRTVPSNTQKSQF